MINVLIIEDDPMVSEFNKRYLEQLQGFNLVAAANDGQEALAVIEEEKVDLILLDIFMPGLNGLELLSELRKKDKEIDVIVISAANDQTNINKALRLGAADYLIKPFEFDRFEASLNRYKNKKTYFDQHQASSQKELDRLLFHDSKGKQEENQELPKGLTRETLGMIWSEIERFEGLFSTDDLTFNVGISRVSTRKYLTFLTEIEALDAQTVYGSVGRPQTLYQRLPQGKFTLEKFL